MKSIIGIGMVLILAGCGTAISKGQTEPVAEMWFSPDKTEQRLSQDLDRGQTEPVAEMWFSPDKTEQQLSQDLDQCRTKCLKA